MIQKHHRLPRGAEKLLKLIVDENTFLTAMEDFETDYFVNLESRGILRSKALLWYRVLSLSFTSWLYFFTWRMYIFENYFKITFRNILKYKGFSAINIFSLAAGLAIGFISIQFIAYFYTFDRTHPQGDRIFRVNTARSYRLTTRKLLESRRAGRFATSPLPLASVLKNEISAIEKSVTVKTRFEGGARYKKKKLNISGYFASQDFFQLFAFQLKRGDESTALNEPYSIVLTEKLADKIFKGEDPLGKILKVKKYGDFIVRGIISEEPEVRSHLEPESLISLSTLAALEKRGIIKPVTSNWDNLEFNYTYVLLKKGTSAEGVESSLNSFVKKYFNNRDYNYSLFMQKISDIIPGKHLRLPFFLEYPMNGLFLLFLLGFIILLTVIFNYTNLSIARYLTRTREVGIRKVIGASRLQIFNQAMGEAIIVAFIALLFAYPFSKYLIHLMLNMVPGHPPPVEFDENLKIFLFFGLYTLMAGCLAGILPALHFSKLKPIKVLNNLFDLKILSKVGLRKALIVFQFSLSLIFIIFTIFVYRQIEFFQTCDYGFSYKNIINVELQGIDYNTFKTETEKHSGIQKVSASAYIPGLGFSLREKLWKKGSKEPVLMGSLAVDSEFLNNLDIALLNGKNFPNHLGTENEKFILITHSATKHLGFQFPVEALGQVVYLYEDQPLQIIGVVKDFFHGYLYDSSGPHPVMLRSRPKDFRYANIRVSHQNVDETVAFIEKTWDRLAPDTPFIYSNYEQRIEHMLLDFMVLQKSMGFISLVLIAIASLGLLGMTFYSIGTRRKEIGIRKVIGATVLAITLLLSKGFFKLLLLAIIIATPISWLMGNFFLQQFPYRIEPGVGLFLTGICVMLLIGLVTVLSQTIKAAYANPLDYIRYE